MANRFRSLRGLFGRAAPEDGDSGDAPPPAAPAPPGTPPLETAKQLMAQGRFDDAQRLLTQTIEHDDSLTEAFTLLGQLAWRTGDYATAAAMCARVVALEPRSPGAHYNLGSMLSALRKTDDAIASYRQAFELNPASAKTALRIGELYHGKADRIEAIRWIRRALEIEPGAPQELVRLAYLNRSVCDWRGNAAEERAVLDIVRAGGGEYPGHLTIFPLTPGEQFANARAYVAKLGLPRPLPPRPRPAAPRKIRLGYMSSDLRDHATGYLMAELFELHDRSKFELLGYALDRPRPSPMADRIEKAFDRFTRIGDAAEWEFAGTIRDDGVDILVDLNGHTKGHALRTLAYRPAPIQVCYLGFPGTMGTDFHDYAIVDPIVVPAAEQVSFTERLVHLPHCYQVNDRRRAISGRTPARAELGLPDDAFVFCCFNNPRKITPAFFAAWTRLLQALPRGVLWLLGGDDAVEENLRREAAAHGVDPHRVVFAPRLPLADHLARNRCADLFLDTLPYNAHTTMSDALWAGLPAITCAGDAFPGRVGASLLQAVGLPQLVTRSLAEYEALASALATDPDRLAAIRRTLAATLHSAPLFDTPRFTAHLEAAYERMWALYMADQSPQPIAIAP
jgi:predicted O-linked N-acetylglucosamine transferase (SPINDLY family)